MTRQQKTRPFEVGDRIIYAGTFIGILTRRYDTPGFWQVDWEDNAQGTDFYHESDLVYANGGPDSARTVLEELTIGNITVTIYPSDLEWDKGKPVVQIDGRGEVRVNMNDYPIWDANPDDHEHTQCECIKRNEHLI